MIFEVPEVESPLAILREIAADGAQRRLMLDGGPVTIGRATDNTLVLRDARVSRYHGRLQARSGALVYSDLGSTNGSRVNGIEIDEVVLGAGDRIEVGDTVLVVESAPGA
jgi:pSer/pThr/pTyr-binding forkhead associated (FHA) protein